MAIARNRPTIATIPCIMNLKGIRGKTSPYRMKEKKKEKKNGFFDKMILSLT